MESAGRANPSHFTIVKTLTTEKTFSTMAVAQLVMMEKVFSSLTLIDVLTSTLSVRAFVMTKALLVGRSCPVGIWLAAMESVFLILKEIETDHNKIVKNPHHVRKWHLVYIQKREPLGRLELPAC